MLVFGAGTDYALLLVARYREELRRHEDRHEAMAFALHRAAPAIVASALTVILGMLCLVFAEMNSTAGLGPVAAIGIGVGLLVMITLLPALLVITGRWIFWPQRPAYDTHEPTSTGFWAKVGTRIAPRPRLVWIGTAAALAVCSLGILQINAHGLSTQDAYTKDFDSVTGQQVLTDHGLADTASPVMVVANADQADAVRSAMTGIDGIGDPSPPIVKGDVALISAQLESDPTSKAAFATVGDVRTAVHRVDGADALVGGASAINTDIETRVRTRQPGDHPARAVRGDDRADGAAAGDPVAVAPDRDRGAVLRRGPRASAPWCSDTSSASPAPTRRYRCSCSCSWSPWASTTTSS